MNTSEFEWDENKNLQNEIKHGVSFEEARFAFFDERRILAEDVEHGKSEKRYFCFGKNRDGTGILTVRFTFRRDIIRIIGAGYWRKGRKVYEQENSLQ